MKLLTEFEQLDQEAIRLVMALPESFLKLGQVLAQIHDQKLWQANFKSFDQYLRSFRERCLRRVEYYSFYTGSGLYEGYDALLDKIISGKPISLLRKNLHELRPISLERSTAYDLIRISKGYGWGSNSLLKPLEILWQEAFEYGLLRFPDPRMHQGLIEMYLRKIGWSKLAVLHKFADFPFLLQLGFVVAPFVSRRELQQKMEELASYQGREPILILVSRGIYKQGDQYPWLLLWPTILRKDPDIGLYGEILLPGSTKRERSLQQLWAKGERGLVFSVDARFLTHWADDLNKISAFFRETFEVIEEEWLSLVTEEEEEEGGLDMLMIKID